MIPRSDRTNSVVEPMLSTQWFVKAKPLAEPALEAVRRGDTVIIPAEWTKTYEHWMTNILDWCISRQLWWGHRIPAWFCGDCDHVTVRNAEQVDTCEKCGSAKLRQDEDVLDTWFSSALWPLSTQGWPSDTPRLRRFYPASDLETGYDILFFWVARMMMMGIHFMGKPPFSRILLHSLVVDETGQKMSKVKGNVIDPLDLIHGATFDTVVSKALPGAPLDEALRKFKKAYPSVAQMGAGFEAYGTDALRFTIASYSAQSKRIPLSPKKIEGSRHFCNKLWNAARFTLPYLEGAVHQGEAPKPKGLIHRWLLSRLGAACAASRQGLDDFRFDDSTSALYHFVWASCAIGTWSCVSPSSRAAKPPRPLATRLPAPRPSVPRIEPRHATPCATCSKPRFAPCTLHALYHEELWHKLPRPAAHRSRLLWPSCPSEAPAGRCRGRAGHGRASGRGHGCANDSQRARSAPWRSSAAAAAQRRRAATQSARGARPFIEALAKTAGPVSIEPRNGADGSRSARPRGAALSVAVTSRC